MKKITRDNILRSLLSLFIILYVPMAVSAQVKGQYPKNYFRWPLNLPPAIVANLGELRPNHWHMGLDIRTNQKVNQPVYAAAAGYIAKIRIERSGFGQCIWINHPNGLTTLYAHLNSFFPALASYITNQQYKQETWAIELEFPKDKFPVTKGQLIALSGSTGGSQGPHVHFEIRDTKTDECINPLLFGMPLDDKVPPTILKLAEYDRSGSIYEQAPVFFPLKKTDTGYVVLNTPVLKTASNRLSFAIQAFDRLSGSKNEDGIFSAQLFFDERAVIQFLLDSISYAETRDVNAQVDYKYHFNGGVFFQHLSQLPGNHSGVYHSQSGDGIISLDDNDIHAIRIEVKDAYGNTSQLKFLVQHSDEVARPARLQSTAKQFLPNYVNVLEKPGFEAYLPENCLYDTIRSYYKRTGTMGDDAVSEMHQLNDPSIPLHAELTVRIKPDKSIPEEWKDRIVIQRSYRDDRAVRKATWQADWMSAKFGDFGVFQAFVDLEAPGIGEPEAYRGKDTLDLSSANRIVFQPTDNFGVRNFRAELDGKWLRFTNDKGRVYIYNFDERCGYGLHQLIVTVNDLAGNTTTRTWWFKKYPYRAPKKTAAKKTAKVQKKKSAKKKK